MNKEGILRWIIYVGAGLMVFTPLLVAGSMYFPYITGKAFYFRILTAVIFGAWAVLAIYYPKYRPHFSPALGALGALIVVALAASLLGVNPGDSIWSNFERMMGWVTLAHVGAAFLALAHTLREKDWYKLFYLSFGVSVITALIAFSEVPEVSRVDAELGNPIYLAAYALVHAMLAGYFMLRAVRQQIAEKLSVWADWQLYAFSAVAILNLLALYFTKTRGAILGLLAGLGLAALLVAIFEKRRAWLRWSAVGLVTLAVVSVALVVGFRDSNFVQNQPVLSRFGNISLEEGTAGARLDIWQMGLEGYSESTKTQLVGWGPGNFNYVFNTYYNPELYDEETWFDRAHNVALEWLVAAGPLGLAAYLSLFGAAIYLIWRDPEAEVSGAVEHFSVSEKSLLTGLTVAYLVQNLFVFDHLVSYILLLWLLGWLHTRAVATPPAGWMDTFRGWFTRSGDISEPVKAWSSTGVVLVVAAAAVWVNYPGMAQATTLIDALREGAAAHQLAQDDRLEQASEYRQRALPMLEEAIDYNAMGTQEARERLLSAAEDVASDHGATSSVASKYFQATSDAYQNQIALEPGDLRHHVFYGRLFSSYGRYEEAVEQFTIANDMGNGQKQKVLFELAEAQGNAGNDEAALVSYRQAHELDTSFPTPAVRYARALIEAGEEEKGEEILMQYETSDDGTGGGDGQTVEQAVEAGNYEAVVVSLKAQIEKDGSDPQTYASLAAAQSRIGNDEAAIETLKAAAEKFPQLTEQVDELIRQIETSNPTRP